MFSLDTKGQTCTVTRTLTLPKSGKLPAVPMESSFKVAFKLPGIDAKSPIAAEIRTQFENVFRYELRRFGTKQDNDFVKRWKELGKTLEDEKDPAKIRKEAEAFQSALLAEWNDFAKSKGKTYAASSFRSVVDAVARDKKADLGKATFSYSADELKASRVNILKGVLAALTTGVATGGLGWAAFAVGGMAALVKGYTGAWQVAQARAVDVKTNLGEIDTALGSAQKTLDALQPRVAKLIEARRSMEAELVKAAAAQADLAAQLAGLEARAAKEKAVREGKVIKELGAKVRESKKEIDSLKSRIAELQTVTKAVQDARKAVTAAADLTTDERKGWDGFMARFSKVESDTNTGLGAVKTLIKQIAKA